MVTILAKRCSLPFVPTPGIRLTGSQGQGWTVEAEVISFDTDSQEFGIAATARVDMRQAQSMVADLLAAGWREQVSGNPRFDQIDTGGVPL